MASEAQMEADQEAEAALENVDQIEGVLRRPSQISNSSSSDPFSAGAHSGSGSGQMIHTAKAERRMREKIERDGGGETDPSGVEDAAMSPAEKRAHEADKRAEWRKARLRSLENVSGTNKERN
jgi:hypothetical protein